MSKKPVNFDSLVCPYCLAKKDRLRLAYTAELAMQRVKRIFGNTMKARKLPHQKTEAWVARLYLTE